MELNPWTVGLVALVTALATGLGAMPFLFIQNIPRLWLSVFSAIAGGLMLGASHGLISNGIQYSLPLLIGGMLLGVLFIVLSHRFLENHKDISFGNLEGVSAVKTFMIVGVMTMHSFSEGVGVGVSFGGGRSLGELIAIAIAIHNIPEGLAISLVMVPKGTPAWRSCLWSIFSSLPQPLMAIPAYLFVTLFTKILPLGLGFAAGAMIWMVFAELIPDALEHASSTTVAVSITLALTAMITFQTLLM